MSEPTRDESDEPGEPNQIEAVVRELLLSHLEPPKDSGAPLELPSLSLVTFAEELEQEFDFVVAARDLLPENFATIARVVAYIERRRSRG